MKIKLVILLNWAAQNDTLWLREQYACKLYARETEA
jgi:hypothetical protein